MQLANHLQLAFGGIGGLFLVFGFFGEPAHHKLRYSGLVFYNICTAFLSHISHPLGDFQIAVVVYPGFSNDRYRHKLLLTPNSALLFQLSSHLFQLFHLAHVHPGAFVDGVDAYFSPAAR